MWLEPLQPAELRDDTLFVRAPLHIRGWVQERYAPRLRAAASQAFGRAIAIELVDPDWRPAPSEGCDAEPASVHGAGANPLNPKYTFDQFVIGEGNRLAHAAALAVAETPAQAYNPLFLHGPPGLGKTHLLQAIGHYIRRHGAGLRVRYATVESFTTDFVQAMRRKEPDGFRERFREVDVLLIDDVQFIADKLRTKEEFFHIFNALYESGRQLVITSDSSPDDMEGFEARLQERFAAGLVADLHPPDLAVRRTILKKRALHDQIDLLGDETLAAIAGHVRGSVRALEGALIRVVADASLRGEAPSPSRAEALLASRPACSIDNLTPTIATIQDVAAQVLSVPRPALTAPDRSRRVAFARQVAMYLARELTGETLPAIGKKFGGRDHTTVLHACRKITGELASSSKARSAVDDVKRELSLLPDRQG